MPGTLTSTGRCVACGAIRSEFCTCPPSPQEAQERDWLDRWARESHPERLVLDGDTAITDQEGLDRLHDYSASVPTGAYPGKMWKRRRSYTDESKGWLLGAYEEHDDPDKVRIVWRDLTVMDERYWRDQHERTG